MKIESIRGLKIYPAEHPKMKNLLESAEDAPEIHGDKVWCSSYYIMDYLIENPPAKKSSVMEIGCGWGLLAIFCAKKFKSSVIAVDADKYVFPFLDIHAEKNGVTVENKVCRYENLSIKLLTQQDLIVGGDICFWDELIEPLMTLIEKTLGENNAKIILADPGRSPFLKLAKQCKKKFNAELIDVKITHPSEEEGYLLVIQGIDK